MFSFFIPIPAISWNKIVCKHWRVYQSLRNEWAMATQLYCKLPKTSLHLIYPVKLRVTCYWKNKRVHDIDGIFFKPVLDQMVKMGIFPDDNLKYIKSVEYIGENGSDKEGVLVEILNS